MFDDHITYLGLCHRYVKDEWVGMSNEDRLRHLHIIGKTGTGKSTLLRNLIAQDLMAGHGLAVIDPHGDLAEAVLECVPPHRFDDVVYFNPADLEWPIGFNLLEPGLADRRHFVASGVVESFKNVYSASWGPRLEYIFMAAVLALLENRNVSLLGVPRMLSDPEYRYWVLKRVRDPQVRFFWFEEFAQYTERYEREAVGPIQNKVGQLLFAPVVRNVFSQVSSGFDLRFMMDSGRILIANLAKGRIGGLAANLIGSLLVTQVQLAAMQRVDVPSDERRPFFLYVDEFGSLLTDSFASMLSETRKYALGLVLSRQHRGQARPVVEDAVFGNVGSHLAFRVGQKDAQVMAEELGGLGDLTDLSDQANFRAYARLLQEGELGRLLELEMQPPLDLDSGRRERLITLSQRKYGTPRRRVEDRIRRWFHDAG